MTAADLRTQLRSTLGLAPTCTPVAAKIETRRDTEGNCVEDMRLVIGQTQIPATLIRPEPIARPPCILYCHARSDPALGRRELMTGSPYLQDPPYGLALARLGFATFCIDMTGFGARRADGTEAALALTYARQNTSLFSVMLGEQSAALDYLRSRGDIRRSGIFTLGFSMGGALAFWLAALDGATAGVAQLGILADRGPMLSAENSDLFSPALAIPGIPEICDMGDVAGLIAPSPQLVCLGGRDPLTPQNARDAALDRLRACYADCTENLETLVDQSAGHAESAAMRVAVLDFLARQCANQGPFGGGQGQIS